LRAQRVRRTARAMDHRHSRNPQAPHTHDVVSSLLPGRPPQPKDLDGVRLAGAVASRSPPLRGGWASALGICANSAVLCHGMLQYEAKVLKHLHLTANKRGWLTNSLCPWNADGHIPWDSSLECALFLKGSREGRNFEATRSIVRVAERNSGELGLARRPQVESR
jgi:hypothetical protein